jgi:hypothetical protein
LFFSSGGEAEGLPENYRAESLNVYTSTLTTLTWDGQEFQWQDTKILKPAYRIDSQEKLEAISSEGKSAVISAEFNNAATLQNDSCQLFVNGAIVGTQFGCKKNFTVVNWQDVTNDDQAELVITTLSGISDVDGRELSDKRCVHQRLLIYERINSQLAEIANVTGCVVQSDLYGVRTLDIDGDGQVEILAANRWLTGDPCGSAFSMISGSQPNCWYEFGHQDEIYKWNGSEFVYWGLLSE